MKLYSNVDRIYNELRALGKGERLFQGDKLGGVRVIAAKAI